MSSILELQNNDDIWNLLLIYIVKARNTNVLNELKYTWTEKYSHTNINLIDTIYTSIIHPGRIILNDNKINNSISNITNIFEIDKIFVNKYYIYGFELYIRNELELPTYRERNIISARKLYLPLTENFNIILERLSHMNNFNDIYNKLDNYNIFNFMMNQEKEDNNTVYCSIEKSFITLKKMKNLLLHYTSFDFSN